MKLDLTFKEFSELNRLRCEDPNGFNHKLDSWSLSDWMTALTGEVGEAANLVKKLNRIRDGVPGNKGVTEKELQAFLADELADVYIYLDLLVMRLGLNMDDIIVSKFNATSQQHDMPFGYIVSGDWVNIPKVDNPK
jgi:NTP pyrophosphatase (non-canonical NTP hydrolase)